MSIGRISVALAAPLLILSAASAVSADVPSNTPFAQSLLTEHNRARDDAGVPRLKWSVKLAGEAKGWADQLAREGGIRHAPSRESGGAGENLWMGSAGYYAPETMVGAFVEERQNYLHGPFPRVSRTGRWEDVGHYTQVVWRDTREVGCAIAQNGRDEFLVCRYWPAGNWMGEVPF
ncbi:MAG TPA: CAP domain-containing protein [Croceibacterium sp.]